MLKKQQQIQLQLYSNSKDNVRKNIIFTDHYPYRNPSEKGHTKVFPELRTVGPKNQWFLEAINKRPPSQDHQ